MDVVAVVYRIGDLRKVTKCGEPIKVRNLQVIGESQLSLNLTLWGKLAHDIEYSVGDVLSCRRVLVNISQDDSGDLLWDLSAGWRRHGLPSKVDVSTYRKRSRSYVDRHLRSDVDRLHVSSVDLCLGAARLRSRDFRGPVLKARDEYMFTTRPTLTCAELAVTLGGKFGVGMIVDVQDVFVSGVARSGDSCLLGPYIQMDDGTGSCVVRFGHVEALKLYENRQVESVRDQINRFIPPSCQRKLSLTVVGCATSNSFKGRVARVWHVIAMRDA